MSPSFSVPICKVRTTVTVTALWVVGSGCVNVGKAALSSLLHSVRAAVNATQVQASGGRCNHSALKC